MTTSSKSTKTAHCILLVAMSKLSVVKEAFYLPHDNFIRSHQKKAFIRALALDLVEKKSKNIEKEEVVSTEIKEFGNDENTLRLTFCQRDMHCAIVLTDMDYPQDVAVALIVEMFEKENLSFKKILKEYQNSDNVSLTDKIHKELEQIKIRVFESFEKLNNRDETLNELVANSNRVFVHAKSLFLTAKEKNSWCC